MAMSSRGTLSMFSKKLDLKMSRNVMGKPPQS